MPATDDVVRARVGAEIKRDSEKALAAMGLTMSEAIRLFLVQTVRLQALPFAVVAPNAKTMQAIDEARSGSGRKHASADALFSELAP
jgi:DNA-damage-inducible protein J